MEQYRHDLMTVGFINKLYPLCKLWIKRSHLFKNCNQINLDQWLDSFISQCGYWSSAPIFPANCKQGRRKIISVIYGQFPCPAHRRKYSKGHKLLLQFPLSIGTPTVVLTFCVSCMRTLEATFIKCLNRTNCSYSHSPASCWVLEVSESPQANIGWNEGWFLDVPISGQC